MARGFLDGIKALFGEGKLRFDVELADGSRGSVKMSYIGDLSTLDMAECKAEVKRRLLVETGKVARTITFVGAY